MSYAPLRSALESSHHGHWPKLLDRLITLEGRWVICVEVTCGYVYLYRELSRMATAHYLVRCIHAMLTSGQAWRVAASDTDVRIQRRKEQETSEGKTHTRRSAGLPGWTPIEGTEARRPSYGDRSRPARRLLAPPKGWRRIDAWNSRDRLDNGLLIDVPELNVPRFRRNPHSASGTQQRGHTAKHDGPRLVGGAFCHPCAQYVSSNRR